MSKPDGTQELDEIEQVIRSVLTPNSYIVPQEGIELTKAILDWHNKQIEEAVLKGRILEASEINGRYFENNDVVHDFLRERIRLNEAERTRLRGDDE